MVDHVVLVNIFLPNASPSLKTDKWKIVASLM